MIFVTVGTHEQQFNRLIKEVDRLKGTGAIDQEVFIQTGYSDFEPQNCQWSKFLSYDDMNSYMKEAEIVITHGGPATFMSVISLGKLPVVVPRRKQFGEHINDHQIQFLKKIVHLYPL
ncbi:multidrug MFS transporter, partial [Streptococcus agalactiae]|nr:multidrug MFS transporter [Streptococcus agalactiae]